MWAALLLLGGAAAYESVAVFELAAETDYTFTTAIDVKVSVVGVGLGELDYFALDEAKTAAAAGVSTCTNAASNPHDLGDTPCATFAAGATTITTPAATDPHAGHDHGRRLATTGFFAFFFEHGLDEIEVSTHYLKDVAGNDVEPVCTLGEGVDPHAGHDHRRRLAECAAPLSDKNEKKKDARAWRNATLASFLVLACTVVGAILRFAFGVGKLEENEPFTMGVAAFAVGCLLATAFYLLLIEASHLLAVSYQTEVQGNWRFGTCVLAGYLLGMVSAAADPSHLYVADDCEEPCCQIEDGGGPESSDIVKADPVDGTVRPPKKVDASFCFAIFLSDFLHNFVDGIFIANAFLDCQQSKGWTVASSTVAHELAQEVSDFFMLVTRGGLTTIQALAVNVVSGASVVIGAWWFLWLEPGNGDRGMLLAFSGGVYVYVAATECAATFVHKNPTWRLKLLNVVLFIIGAVAIGLVLLDHSHCSGDQDKLEDPHAGHNH